MSFHLHAVSPVKLSLTVNWESSKGLILLNSASFCKNSTRFNASIALCSLSSRADSLAPYCHLVPCPARWHRTATRALLRSLAPYCYLALCSLSSRADSLAPYCHLAPCSARWHRTATRALLRSLAPYCYLAPCSTRWHHTATRALLRLLAPYCYLVPCSARWHCTATRALLRSLALYCYLMLCSLSSRADLLAPYCYSSRAPLRPLAPYCQISMFHSWTSCEGIQGDQLCWSNAQVYRDQMSKEKERHRLSIKLVIAQPWKHIKMEYGEILNFTLQCDASINFCLAFAMSAIAYRLYVDIKLD